MTTLPATIPGLVRRGSPCRVRRQWVVNGAPMEHWWGDRLYACPAHSFSVTPGDQVFLYAGTGQEVERTDRVFLDLTDPTGRVHALLWLAEKPGMDARYGLLWCHVPRQDFDHGQYTPAYRLLAGATPDSDGVTLRSWRWVFTEESSDDPRCAEYFFGKGANIPPDGYTTVPGILSTGDTEALRLAVLAVAGVER